MGTSTAPGANFSTRHTYAWEPNPQMGGSMDESMAGQDIHAAVNQALEARGFRLADGQPPDFLVDYRVKLQRESEIEGGRWQMQEYNYTKGTLIVTLVAPKSKLFLWRGDAQGSSIRRSAAQSSRRRFSRRFKRCWRNFRPKYHRQERRSFSKGAPMTGSVISLPRGLGVCAVLLSLALLTSACASSSSTFASSDELFDDFDSDNNDTLDQNEWDQARQNLDADADGVVTRDEFNAAAGDLRGGGGRR